MSGHTQAGFGRNLDRTSICRLILCLTLFFGMTAAPLTAQQVTNQAITADQAYDRGLAYLEGRGVLQNFAEAAAWLTPAAEAGHPGAQNALGRLYHEGLGVAQDPALALTLLTRAATAGAPEHLFDLASVLEPQDPAEAARLYQQAVEGGHQEAAVNLAVLYQDGRGVAQDYGRAHALYRPAAEAGNARAQNNLGLLYVRGHGVAQNYEQAALLFAAAAEQGLAKAMTNLGVLYENGFGVGLDEAQAEALYRAAGNRQDPTRQLVYDARLTPAPDGQDAAAEAAHNRALAAGDPIAEFQQAWRLAALGGWDNDRQAAALFAAGAARGHGPSMVNRALFYVAGRGGAQDYVLGQMWLLLAGAAGQPGIDAISASILPLMTSSQINEAQEMALAAQ